MLGVTDRAPLILALLESAIVAQIFFFVCVTLNWKLPILNGHFEHAISFR